jgi:hypothetical protein
MDMNDEDRKLLTKFLSECWHEVEYEGDSFCQHCEEHYTHAQNRAFTTAQDMMDLKDKLVEKGMWKGFLRSAFNSIEGCATDISTTYDADCPDEQFYNEDFFSWIMDSPRFCQLVADLLKEE